MHSSKWISDYFQLSMASQIAEFKNHSIDEQYELYIYGNQVVHPPAIYLARPFAEQGSSIVPLLSAKLRATEKETTIRDIAAVFSEVSKLKLYDFSKDPELMQLLDQRANAMHGVWKKTTLEMISQIRTGK